MKKTTRSRLAALVFTLSAFGIGLGVGGAALHAPALAGPAVITSPAASVNAPARPVDMVPSQESRTEVARASADSLVTGSVAQANMTIETRRLASAGLLALAFAIAFAGVLLMVDQTAQAARRSIEE